MPKDSRSIVIDYNVLKQNEDMGVGSTAVSYTHLGKGTVGDFLCCFAGNETAYCGKVAEK